MPVDNNTKTQPVLVTGASGYIAGWIIKYLLEAGYTVHATVRDPNKQSSVAHLLRMAEKSTGTLKLFKADLLTQGSFSEAMQGCSVVMHTASPFVLDGFIDANEALVRPAVEGTANVLNSVNDCDSVKRVVLTSSVAAIYGDNKDILAVPSGVLLKSIGIPRVALIIIRINILKWLPSAKHGVFKVSKAVGTWLVSTLVWFLALHSLQVANQPVLIL
jgi:nucleoside-diphosphate-sugar epimerase